MNSGRDPWGLVPPRWMLVGVLVLVATAFGSTLFFGFVYDDHWTLLDNGFLRSPGDIGLLFTPEATARHVPDAFRPMSVLFEMLAYQVLGQSAFGHHALSLVLHVAVAAALAKWLEGLGAPLPLRISTALLFGVLAIHAEAVAVVSYREDLLAALLGLVAMILADKGRIVAAGIAVAVAAGAKLSAAPIPLLYLLAHRLSPWRPAKPPPWAAFAALAAGVALVLAHRFVVIGGVSPYAEASGRVFAHRVGWSPVWAASVQIHLSYLAQMVVPHGLSPEYVDYGARWTDGATLCGAGAFALLLGAGVASVRKRPVAALAILGAMLLALPTSNLAPMPNMRADRLMYLPSVPVCLGLAAILLTAGDALARRFSGRLVPVLPLVLVAVLNGAAAQGASGAYRSDTRLWAVALLKAPNSARAHAVRGELLVLRLRQLQNAGDATRLLLQIRSHCALAERLDPTDALPHLCAARLAAAQEDWPAAHAAFERGLARSAVRSDRALVAMASVTLDLPDVPYPQRVERSLELLTRATRNWPYVAEVFAVDGRIRHRLGRPEEARTSYRRARKLHPERWDLVMAGLELELDLGHSSPAWRVWARQQLDHPDADPRLRDTIRRRLANSDLTHAP